MSEAFAYVEPEFEVLQRLEAPGADLEFLPLRLAPNSDALLELVYVIQAGRAGPVKIGRTTYGRLPHRLRELQTGHHEVLKLVGAFPGYAALEAYFHRSQAQLRVRSEWFKPQAAWDVGRLVDLMVFAETFNVDISWGEHGPPPAEPGCKYARPFLAGAAPKSLTPIYWQRIYSADSGPISLALPGTVANVTRSMNEHAKGSDPFRVRVRFDDGSTVIAWPKQAA